MVKVTFSIRIEKVNHKKNSGRGFIQVGNYLEYFDMDFSYWSKEDYEHQWIFAIEHLLNEGSSRLITWILHPKLTEHLITTWPLWKIGNKVILQQHLLIREKFNDRKFHKEVGARSSEKEDTNDENDLSKAFPNKWETQLENLESFINGTDTEFFINIEEIDPTTKLGKGVIEVGTTPLEFDIVFNKWSEDDYKNQWVEAVRRLKEYNTSCFITYLGNPEYSDMVYLWPLQRIGNKVCIYYEKVLLLDDIEKSFNLNIAYEYAKELIGGDSEYISEDEGDYEAPQEWETTINALGAFLLKVDKINDDEERIIRSLKDSEIKINRIRDLVYDDSDNFNKSIPILTNFLKAGINNKSTLQGLIRVLDDIRVKDYPEISKLLIKEYYKLPKSEEFLRIKIGETIKTIVNDQITEDLINLVKDHSNGRTRNEFILALGNVDKEQYKLVESTLIELLSDDQIIVTVIESLRNLKSSNAEHKIRPLTRHKKSDVRIAAKKYIKEISSIG